MGTSDVWVVVPAFDEGPVIAQVLADLVRLPYGIVVVDDGSADDTAQQASAFPVTVLRHVCNLGQGAALQTGISYALSLRGTKFIVTFDSDGQHNAEDIPRLLEPLGNGTHDVALGSRFLGNGGAVNISTRKRVLLRLAVAFTRLTTGLDVTDTHNGLRALTAKAAGQMRITQNRMAHASEILSQIARLRLRYCEVPVTVTYTLHSTAKGQTVFDSINIIWDIMMERVR